MPAISPRMNRNTAPPAYSTELADGFFNEGMRCVRTRDFETAARAFRDAVSVDPEHSEAQNNLGAALAALNRHEEAVSAYRSALEIDADYAQAYFNLGASL